MNLNAECNETAKAAKGIPRKYILAAHEVTSKSVMKQAMKVYQELLEHKKSARQSV